jgi:hypothetical protein
MESMLQLFYPKIHMYVSKLLQGAALGPRTHPFHVMERHGMEN